MTVNRPELLNDGTDRDFRKLVHNIFAFMARHEAIRDGHARQIGLAGVEYTILISIGHLGLDGDVNVKTVADHLHMSGAFVTTVTSKLQTLGLAEKKPGQRRPAADLARHHRKRQGAAAEACALSARNQRRRVRIAEPRRFQTLSRIIEDLIASSDEAFALQRYKSSIKDATKVAEASAAAAPDKSRSAP